jgi:hypothetical protein
MRVHFWVQQGPRASEVGRKRDESGCSLRACENRLIIHFCEAGYRILRLYTAVPHRDYGSANEGNSRLKRPRGIGASRWDGCNVME